MTDERAMLQMAAEAKAAIVEGHISDALSLLRVLATEVGDELLIDYAELISEDYDRLLACMSDGIDDPERAKQYERVIHLSVTVVQDIRRAHRLARRNDGYTTTARSLDPTLDAETADADELFNLYWTSSQLTGAQLSVAKELIDALPPARQAYALSALTLALFEYFDPRRLVLLVRYSQCEDPLVRSRAMVGLCLSIHIHADLVSLYPDIVRNFHELGRNNEVALVQHLLVLSGEAERLHNRIERNTPPDEEQMKRLAQLLQEGVDVNLDAFVALKRFPFFRTPGHWLKPYEAQSDDDVVARFSLCDSDKHSLRLFLDTMANEGEGEQTTNILTGLPLSEPVDEHMATQFAFVSVVQSLYRLLERSRWKHEWRPVFQPLMVFVDSPLHRSKVGADVRYLRSIASAMMKYRHFDEAKRHLRPILRLDASERGDVWDRIATCERRMGRREEAAAALRKAIAYKPDAQRLRQRLARLLGELGRTSDELSELTELERLAPGDPDTLYATGLCLMKQGQWAEAKQRFYQLEATDQRVEDAVRALAWCELKEGNLSQAHMHYHRLLGEMHSTEWEDRLNLGHVLWLEGDPSAALAEYVPALRKRLEQVRIARDPLAPFDNDGRTLAKLGKEPADVCIMHDLIQRQLSKA